MNTSNPSKDVIVYTTGVFDLLHYGHINFLNKARDLGDILVVGLVDDEAVRQEKGDTRPFMSWAMRKYLLQSLICVDYVIKQVTFEPNPKIRVSVIAKGEDQDHVSEDFALKNDIPIVRLQRTEGVSTSKLGGEDASNLE